METVVNILVALSPLVALVGFCIKFHKRRQAKRQAPTFKEHH